MEYLYPIFKFCGFYAECVLWVSFAIVFLAVFSETVIPVFESHIYQCVVVGTYPVGDSRIHFLGERLIQWLIERMGKLGTLIGFWMTVFCLLLLFPLVLIVCQLNGDI